jgi:MFS family permease
MSSLSIAARLRFARALRSQPFALLWAGQTISALGDGAYLTALAWQVLLLTGSAKAMGVVLIARSIPMLLFLLLGGVAADRLPRRLVMLASDAGRGISVLAVALLGQLHLLQLWHLIVLSLIFGFVAGFFLPAYQSIAPELVAAEDLPSANGLTGLSRQISILLGPLLGALLVATTGPVGAFAFDGLTFAASALFLLALRVPKRTTPIAVPASSGTKARRRGVRGVLADVREGLGYILASSWLWVTIAVASVVNMGWSGTLVVALPKLIRDVYHADVGLFGALATAEGLGAILATVVVGQAKRLHHRGILAYAGLIAASLALIAFGLPLPRAILPFVALGASVVIGAALGIFDVVWVSTLQKLVPSDKLGRVSSVDWLGSLCLQPLGFALAGVLADAVGPAWVFVGAGVMNTLLSAGALGMRGIRRLE